MGGRWVEGTCDGWVEGVWQVGGGGVAGGWRWRVTGGWKGGWQVGGGDV